MSQEIERKFLVLNSDYKRNSTGTPYIQGYLSTDMNRVVRIRIMGDKAVLTIKGRTGGLVRPEFEYSIPANDAKAILALCIEPLIEKIRYKVPFEGMVWEVDEFKGINEGLVIAEIELNSEAQFFVKPDWVGSEVTYDSRYANTSLIHSPYKTWADSKNS